MGNKLYVLKNAKELDRPIYQPNDPNKYLYVQRASSSGKPYYVHIESGLTDWNIDSLRTEVKSQYPNLLSGGKLYKKAKKDKKRKKSKKSKKGKK